MLDLCSQGLVKIKTVPPPYNCRFTPVVIFQSDTSYGLRVGPFLPLGEWFKYLVRSTRFAVKCPLSIPCSIHPFYIHGRGSGACRPTYNTMINIFNNKCTFSIRIFIPIINLFDNIRMNMILSRIMCKIYFIIINISKNTLCIKWFSCKCNCIVGCISILLHWFFLNNCLNNNKCG